MDTIFSRHSVRKYTSEPIPQDRVEKLLRAGMAAPSAGNQQPWQFVLIDDHDVLKAFPKFHPYASMAPEAALAIVVCGDLTLEKHSGRWVQDCSAAVQNILLEAHALGLGAVWVGIFPNEERVQATRKLLRLPEHIIPLALIPLGNPDEEKGPKDRYQPDRIHHNHW